MKVLLLFIKKQVPVLFLFQRKMGMLRDVLYKARMLITWYHLALRLKILHKSTLMLMLNAIILFIPRRMICCVIKKFQLFSKKVWLQRWKELLETTMIQIIQRPAVHMFTWVKIRLKKRKNATMCRWGIRETSVGEMAYKEGQ